MKRTNQHLHPPEEKAISCSEVKINIKRKAKGTYHSGTTYNTRRIYADIKRRAFSLIFATQKNIDMLQISRVWLADGTFRTAPLLFTQVYVVHALRRGPDLLKDGHFFPSILFYFPTNRKQHIKECGNRCSFFVSKPTQQIC